MLAQWSSAANPLRSRFVQVLLLYPCLRILEALVERRSGAFSRTAPFFAIADVFKSAYAIYALRYKSLRTRARRQGNALDEEYFLGETVSESGPVKGSPRTGFYLLCAVCAGMLWAVHGNLYARALELNYDLTTLHVATAMSAMLVLLGQYCVFGRTEFNATAQLVVLQLAGVLIAGSTLSPSPSAALLAIPSTYALAALSIEFCYRLYPSISPYQVNLTLFVSSLLVHVVISVNHYPFDNLATASSDLSFWDGILLSLRVVADMWALKVINDFDSLTEGVLRTLAFVVTCFDVQGLSAEDWIGVICGNTLDLWSALSYLTAEFGLFAGGNEPLEQKRRMELNTSNRHRRIFGLFSVLVLGSICWLFPFSSQSRMPHVLGVDDVDAQCIAGRKPLPVPALPNRTYKHFDNVLLVVFFSHARYDVNLDNYRAVYADYFPNMVFVGPKTREDAGFRHSYDVLVDSYQAEEDLRDNKNYKMAGRMAHHMLYSAMQEYPCYDGYLWAPFDTFLNVPRLQQFDLDKFWYHSPFAKYVPNSALGNIQENQDRARHPPPANISPDLSLNLTENWHGWSDWWWGDPNVGVSECMPAFLESPEEQRLRLATYLDGDTRFIGGSVDTLYIPGRHRARLLHTLGLFLETNCFLEIALPTVLHLIVPLDEEIQYVDHHWIWYPPFNGDFVRQQWLKGFEVDTFHTFHWGDLEDGVWHAHPELVEDTRNLLQESAMRQQLTLPKHE